jgi:hypothetical protein
MQKIKDMKMVAFAIVFCVRGAKTGGGEDNDDHKSLSSIFHKNDENIIKENTKMITFCCHFHV